MRLLSHVLAVADSVVAADSGRLHQKPTHTMSFTSIVTAEQQREPKLNNVARDLCSFHSSTASERQFSAAG